MVDSFDLFRLTDSIFQAWSKHQKILFETKNGKFLRIRGEDATLGAFFNFFTKKSLALNALLED